MAVRKLSISKLLQCRHHTLSPHHRIILSSSSSLISNPIESHHYYHHRYLSTDVDRFITPYKFSSSSLSFNRSFSTDREKPIATDYDYDEPSGFFDDYATASVVDTTAAISSEITTAAAAVGGAILPVRCLVWFLDQVHALTGMPWYTIHSFIYHSSCFHYPKLISFKLCLLLCVRI